ncbi:DUF397 domain-containing protein [Streptomyces axinellae]
MSNQAHLNWFKSSYSSAQGDNCVEVATTPARIHVRDSKDTSVPALVLPPTAWTTFIAHAHAHAHIAQR